LTISWSSPTLCGRFLELDPRIRVVGIAADGLPGMTGIEATQRLLAIQPQTRVLIITGRCADEAERDARAAGAID
jgi:DNA-binding NarL/FixJ family response regulator